MNIGQVLQKCPAYQEFLEADEKLTQLKLKLLESERRKNELDMNPAEASSTLAARAERLLDGGNIELDVQQNTGTEYVAVRGAVLLYREAVTQQERKVMTARQRVSRQLAEQCAPEYRRRMQAARQLLEQGFRAIKDANEEIPEAIMKAGFGAGALAVFSTERIDPDDRSSRGAMWLAEIAECGLR